MNLQELYKKEKKDKEDRNKVHHNNGGRGEFYATLHENKYQMVMSTGIPPNFPDKRTVEVHLLDLPDSIDTFYGEQLEVETVGFIRNMDKYDSIDELISAIKKDIEYAKTRMNI